MTERIVVGMSGGVDSSVAAALLVEQDVEVALDLAKHVVVMDRGRVSKAGSSMEISQDHAIRAAYLGVD